MNTLTSLRQRHNELLGMIRDLKIMLNPEQMQVKAHAKATHELLCALGRKLQQHLLEEDKGVYPLLLTQEDAKLKSLAWGFISGQKPLRTEFDEYHRRWLKECDFKFTQNFLDETHDIFSAIEDRIERERTVLLPKLEESGLFAASPA